MNATRLGYAKHTVWTKKNPQNYPARLTDALLTLFYGSGAGAESKPRTPKSTFDSLDELFWRGWVFELPTAADCLTRSI